MIGSVAGALLKFDTTGVEFAMTALFLVIAVDQWRSYRSHIPAILGAAATLLCLKLVGPDTMLLPALGIIVVVLLVLRTRLENQEQSKEKEAETKC